MRIGELGRRAEVPVPTIKYYLREGLMAYGEASGPNQVHYDDEHLRRLRLIRSLTEIGGLSVARTRDVLDAVDDTDGGLFKALGVVHHAVSGDQAAAETAGDPRGEAEAVNELLSRQGWLVGEDNPGRARLADLLGVLHRLGQTGLLSRVDDYADLAERLALIDLRVLAEQETEARDVQLETLVVATVLGDQLLATLRHLAQTHLSRERMPTAQADDV